jgi:hypothetical protein
VGLARVALAVAISTGASPSHASPLSLELGFGGGVGYAERAGAYRDDGVTTLRLGIGLAPRFALDFAISEDVERIELALHAGVRLRWPCSVYWSPYLHGDLAVVNASHTASNLDTTGGFGQWGRFSRTHAPWLAWYVETNLVARFGEPNTISARLDAGLAFAPSFWR